jgi:hypothetical protein
VVDSISSNITFARAYPEYFDESYLVHIGHEIYHRLELISNIIGAVVMILTMNLTQSENKLLHDVLIINLSQISGEKPKTDEIGKLLYLHDKNQNTEFSDLYVKYTNEVFEVALAFLIGHEIGHHYHGDTKGTYVKTIKNVEMPIMSVDDPRIRELVADKFALGFVLEYIIGNNGAEDVKLHQGCAVFATLIASALLGDPIETGKTHPSLLLRINILKDEWKKV